MKRRSCISTGASHRSKLDREPLERNRLEELVARIMRPVLAQDEFFVTAELADRGVAVENLSETDPLVILKHFGPGNPDAEPLRKKN